MSIWDYVVAPFKLILGVLLPIGTYKGTVSAQITTYKRLRAMAPKEAEDNILNALIMSRVQAPFGDTPPAEEFAHYEPLLQKSDKTLEDVIKAIVNYEYFDNPSRKALMQRKQFPQKDVENMRSAFMRYVEKSVKLFREQ